MIDKADLNKMSVKSNNLKKENGTIYGTNDGVVDYHTLESMPIKSYGDSLLHIIDGLMGQDETLEDKIQVLKEVILQQNERIQELERRWNEYVG